MSESSKQSTIARTCSWTWQVLGVLLGTATAISIIRNGFAIDVYGLPAKALAQYIWLRDTLFEPLVWAVLYFGIQITWWVKDTIMTYALLAAAHARAFEVMSPLVRDEGDFPSTLYERMQDAVAIAVTAILWPRTSWRLLLEWAEAKWDQEYYTRQGADPYWHDVMGVVGTASDAASELRRIGFEVVIVSVATTAFFFWNYLSGLYGPA
jgi:hypothetical protein